MTFLEGFNTEFNGFEDFIESFFHGVWMVIIWRYKWFVLKGFRWF